MNIIKALAGVVIDTLVGRDGSIVDRISGTYHGQDVQICRHNGDDSSVTVEVNGRMASRQFHLDEVKDWLDVST